ncbi:hypothetical protein TA3x_004801 [Tundrisphaera sp. TA3]|uniref:hypothetical protein n=1 Tax=Tundrisphaera sp. TA3 TaxID=3435775 RepID=UPI003EBAC24A
MPVVADIAGFPGFEVEFRKDGSPAVASDLEGAARFASERDLTDLVVASHGWNNDMAEARALYANLFGRVRGLRDGGRSTRLDDRKIGVLAILWPSKKFAERDLIPGGAAAMGGPPSPGQVREIQGHIDALGGFFDRPGADQSLDRARLLIPQLEDSPGARRRFADLIRSTLAVSESDPEGEPGRFVARDGESLMRQLRAPILVGHPPRSEGGKAAAGLRDMMGGVTRTIADAGRAATDAAGRLLNLATYYQMKDRAGVIGLDGCHRMLGRVRAESRGIKLHLIGHSFGGRLLTAACLGPEGRPAIVPQSLTLLQAAFSHDGFGTKIDGTRDGYFRRVVAQGRVAGPILISHTANDYAVGIAYALASRLAGQAGAAIGDAGDRFGGIGRNGAQKTPEAIFTTLGPVGTPYDFRPGRVYNLRADRYIGGHGDIARDEVAHALLSAIAAT